VVGGAGFLGSHLTDHLIEDRGCNVLVIDNLVSGNLNFVHNQAKFAHHDITGSEDYLCSLFIDNHIQYVFNYAAYPYIPVSFERPLHVLNVNCFGALKVINAAQTAGCDGILQVSSAEIYGEVVGSPGSPTDERCKIDEFDKVQPHSTYGAGKAAIDYLVSCRWKEAMTPVISLRQFNCVGERETHPYVIPEIISQIYRADGDQVTVRLGNDSFRDFLYAGDQAKAAVELLERGEWGEVYNLGSETGVKIYRLAEMIGSLMGCRIEVKLDPKKVRPWEIWHLQSDNTKIYNVIKHRPQVTLIEALQKTIAYYHRTGRKWIWEKSNVDFKSDIG
jgi:nucleoside-diphosphate-sugar epimerase